MQVGRAVTISYGVMQLRALGVRQALARFGPGTPLAEDMGWLALYQMGTQVLTQSAAYHGPPNVETKRPLKECLAVRGSRRMTGTSTSRAPSASECATDMLVRDLPASDTSNSGRGSGDGSLQQVSGIGPRSEQRFISAGITSLPGLLNMFFEGKDGDMGRMRSFIQVRLHSESSNTSYCRVGSPCSHQTLSVLCRPARAQVCMSARSSIELAHTMGDDSISPSRSSLYTFLSDAGRGGHSQWASVLKDCQPPGKHGMAWHTASQKGAPQGDPMCGGQHQRRQDHFPAGAPEGQH